jgi:surface-anchored protein
MKLKNIIATAALAGLSLTQALAAPTIFSRGHTDVGIAFEGGEFDLHVHSEEFELEADAAAAVLRVLPSAEKQIPANPAFSFLGTAGDPIWVLSQDEATADEDGTLLLGIGAEEIEPSAFTGNISVSLTNVAFTPEPGGLPDGKVSVYTVSGSGVPTIVMSNHDGLDSADTATVIPGTHFDANWAFTKPGRYVLTLQATGTPTGGAPVTGSAQYTFVVKSSSSWSDTQVQSGEPIAVGAGAGLITAITPVAVAPDRSGLFIATLKKFGENAALITPDNDRAILRVSEYVPEIIAREGDAMNFIPGTKIKAFTDANASEDGTILVNTMLATNVGGVLSTSDTVLAIHDTGGLYPAVREGDAVPGFTGYRFLTFNSYLPANNAQVLVVGTIRNDVEKKTKTIVFRASPNYAPEILAATGEVLATDAGPLTVKTIARPVRLNQPFGHTGSCIQILLGFTDGSTQLVRFAPRNLE